MSYVYFIVCKPLDAIKIGFTKLHPLARLSSLQTGCPSPLKLHSWAPATIVEERYLHESFLPLHIQGEWFRFEGKLFDFANYMSDDMPNSATRETFENALHDVLMQGIWYPYGDMSEDQYLATGDWKPFRSLLWDTFGPWEDA